MWRACGSRARPARKAEGRRFDPAPDRQSTSNLWTCDQAKRLPLLGLLNVMSHRRCPFATVVCCSLGHAEATAHDLLGTIGNADPAAQQDRRHNGRLYGGARGRHPHRTQEARTVPLSVNLSVNLIPRVTTSLHVTCCG